MRSLGPATVGRHRAAGREGAARLLGEGIRGAAAELRPRQALSGIGRQRRGEQRTAVGMKRAREDRLDVRDLDRLAQIHDRDAVGEMLDRFPNVHVEIGARIGELGRQPRTAARFFDKYQDRILFGTDAIPHGVETPQQVFGEDLYRIYYRFLETADEYFDYAPAKVPPQGRWRIYGVALPEQILRKVYHQNAERVLGMKLVGA